MIIIEDLLNQFKTYNNEDLDFIKKAYNYANELHYGQIRESGDAYITHPLEVAYILSDMHADKNTICAALLHDTLEDTNAKKEEIEILFNKDIANLVEGVTKIDKVNFISKKEQNLANTRKIITGCIEDVRIIIIKLADRLHNMRTLEYKSEKKQQEIALETLEIFVPFAYYIGAYKIKNELEDLSFKYLNPYEYQNLNNIIQDLSEENNSCLIEMKGVINELLNKKSIKHHINTRTKNVYSIYNKINKGYKISDIHDLLSLKVIVEDIKDCYLTLGNIHSKYKPINHKFKDYISNPKTNMYSSLHTTVFGPNDKIVQTQIRTFDMDKIASYGLTAYWDNNKENAKGIMQEDLKSKFQFFKSLIEINYMYKDNEDFVSEVKSEVLSNKIYIYLLNGKIIEIPKGANIIDLACYVGVENSLIGAKVNDELVPMDYILKNKDRVNILTDKLSYGNRDNWIKKANTDYAKTKIKKLERE